VLSRAAGKKAFSRHWNGHCEFAIVTARSNVVPRRRGQRVVGSNTNAREIVDLPFIGPDSSPEEVLDVAVEYTFPASDPIAIEDAYRIRLGSEQH
jgi:hypothetical protein